MSSLDYAIQRIHEGQKEEARQILESLLKGEPGNIQAWFWYVETLPTTEKRIQILEVCLKRNPGNPQVIEALQALRTFQSKQAAQTTFAPPAAQPFTPPISQTPTAQAAFTPPPVQPPAPPISQTPQSSPIYSDLYDDKTEESAPAWDNSPLYFDDEPAYPSAATNTPQQQSTGKQKKAWEMDNASYVDTSMLSKSKPATKSYAFYDAWMTVLATMDIESYENVLNDPEAGAGRAFEWVAYAGIISGLIFPLTLMNNPQFKELMNMPEFSGIFGNMGTTALMVALALVMALLTPIFSVIGLAISAGIQNFLALLFGGNGTFGRTTYAIAAYLAPMTILVAVLGIIPFVGQCLTGVAGIYNIILNVRALRAAHSISIWQALGVMFAPTIVLFIFACLLILLAGLPGLSN